jgi:hypothetical protein
LAGSATVISIGAVCFGIVVGFITYRTLVFKEGASIGDISAVVGAVGGGVVTVWSDQGGGDSFAWYSIGLLGGVVLYYIHTSLRGSEEIKGKLSGSPHGSGLPGPRPGGRDAVRETRKLAGPPHGSGLRAPESHPKEPRAPQ